MDCGHGIQTRIVECQRVADNVTVNETFCLVNISTPKPKTQKCCRGSSCVGTWGYDDWGKVYLYHARHMSFHNMIIYICSVKQRNVMQKGTSTEMFIVTMETD